MTTYKTAGSKDFLSLFKTGYLNSRKTSATSILRSYNWAISQVEAGNCVIGGFHSKIEKDVLHFLLKGNQPLIIVLARGMYKNWQPEIKARLDIGNLLIISPFEDKVKAVTPQTCLIRNKLIVELADKIVIGYARPNGQIFKLLKNCSKTVEYLDHNFVENVNNSDNAS